MQIYATIQEKTNPYAKPMIFNTHFLPSIELSNSGFLAFAG